MEVAALGLRVDGVDGIDRARDSLDGLSKASGRAEKSTEDLRAGSSRAKGDIDGIASSSKGAESRVSALGEAAKKAGGYLAAAFTANALKNYADSWSDMQSRVGAAIGDMDAAASAMNRVVEIANASYSPLQQTVAVYARNVATFADLGRNASQAADFTEAMNHALVTTATRGQDADVVVNSLSRALATGGLNAQDFDTIVSRSPRVLKAMADELKTTTSGLRAMAVDGKVTSQVIASGLTNSLEQLRKEAALMPATIGDALTRVNTNFTEFVGRIDKATGASAAISGAIMTFADGIRTAGDYVIRFGQLAAPAFDAVSGAMSFIAPTAEIALAAVAGFAAPALLAGVYSLTTALGVGLVGAIKAVTAAMMANPVGLVVGILAAAGYAAYKFSQDFRQFVSEDVVGYARTAANFIINSFAAAFEDIRFVWSNLGNVIGAAFVGAANAGIFVINDFVKAVRLEIDGLIGAINKIPGVKFDLIGPGDGVISEFGNKYLADMADDLEAHNARIAEIMSTDRIGQLAARWNKSADVVAAAGDKTGKAIAAAGKGAASATARAAADMSVANAKIEAALNQLEIVWNRGDTGADRYFSERIRLAEAAATAQEKALQAEIAALKSKGAVDTKAQEQADKLVKAEANLQVARIKNAASLASLRAEEEAYYRGPSMTNIKTLDQQSFAIRDQNIALEEQIRYFGLTESKADSLRAARLSEAIATQQANLVIEQSNLNREDEVERINGVIAALYNLRTETERRGGLQAQVESKEKEKERIDASVQSWGKGIDKIGELFVEGFSASLDKNGGAFKAFTDNAGKALKNSVATALYEATIKPVVIRFVAQLAGGIGGAGVQAGILKAAGMDGQGGVGQGLGIVNTIQSAWSAMSGGLTSTLASGVGAIGSAIGSSALSNLALGISGKGATLAAGLAGPTTAGAGGLVGAGSMIGAALPWVAGAAAIYGLISAFGNNPETRTGAQYGLALDGQLYNPRRGTTVGSADGVQFLEGPSGGGASSAVQQAIQGTVDGINGLFETVGAQVSLSAFWAGFEGSEKGRGGVGAGGALSTGAMFGEQGTGDNYRGTLFDQMRATTLSAEEALNLLPAQLAQASLQAWQSAADMFPPALARALQGADLAGMTDEALIALRDQFVGMVAEAEMLRVGLAALPWAPATAKTFAFAAALADAAGGAENAANLLTGYYQTYFDEAEQMAFLTGSLATRFDALGMSIPTTLKEMRGQIEANMALGEAGAATTAALLGLAPELATLIGYTEAQAKAEEELAKQRAESMRQSAAELVSLRSSFDDIVDPAGRLTRQQQALADQFGALGQMMPATLSDYAKLVELTRQAGDAHADEYRKLLELAPGMDAYLRALQDQDDAAKSAADAVRDSARAFADAQQSARDSIMQSIGGLQERIVLDSLGTDQARYGYWDAQFQMRAGLIDTLTDPAAIADATAKAVSAAGNAYGLLDDAGRAATNERYLKTLADLQERSLASVERAQQESTAAQAKANAEAMKPVIDAAVKAIERAASEGAKDGAALRESLKQVAQMMGYTASMQARQRKGYEVNA